MTFADHIQEQPVKKEPSASKKVVATKEEKTATPPRPKAPASLLKWNQMLEVDDKLRKQNQTIFKVESDRNDVYMELAKYTGIFNAGKRKKLQEEYDTLTTKIDNMKSRLGNWEAKYGKNSLQRKLTEKQAEVKKRQEEREYIYRPPTNRGAR